MGGRLSLRLGRLDGDDRVAERDVGRRVERERDRGELPLVRDGQRRHRRRHVGEGAQRHLIAVDGLHVDLRERVGVLLELGLHLEDDAVQVELGEDGRHLALAEGVVERVVDGLQADAQARRRVAIDGERHLEARRLLIAGHVAELGEVGHRLEHLRAPTARARRRWRPPGCTGTACGWRGCRSAGPARTGGRARSRSTWASLGWRRAMISSAPARPDSRGLSVMERRPLLVVALVPSAPMNEDDGVDVRILRRRPRRRRSAGPSSSGRRCRARPR